MKPFFYKVSPSVVPADRISEIRLDSRLSGLSLHEYQDGKDGYLEVETICADGLFPDGGLPESVSWGAHQPLKTVYDESTDEVVFQMNFRGEGEHDFRLVLVEKMADGIHRWPLFSFSVYSLKPDLYPLLPLRGDFHTHTRRSPCGSRQNTAGFVLAEGRLHGYDFMAVTDHRGYLSDAALTSLLDGLPPVMTVFPGEEVHLPEHFQLHFLNIGGSRGISDEIRDNRAEFEAQVQARLPEVPSAPEGAAYLMAASDLVFDRIHAAGGMAVFCHPHWRSSGHFILPEPVKEYILSQEKFDAMEIVGHSAVTPETRGMNALSIAWWQQACMQRGRMIPPVGDTDSHQADEHLGHNATIVFVTENTRSGIVDAIRGGRSVAGEFINGEFPHLFGDFRLVRYAHFLLREYFPLHDARCEEEGRILLDHFSRDPGAAARLNGIADKIPAIRRYFFAN